MYKVGDKIYFVGERMPYVIQACDERYLICTKPFAAKHTVIYSIVDLKEQIRGTENLIFCMGFEDQKSCQEALERLQNADSEISYRNRVVLEFAEKCKQVR